MDQNTNNGDGLLRPRKPPKQESAISSTGLGTTNDEGGLALPFSIGVICLVLAVAAFLLLSFISMSYGLTLFLNILFPVASLIGVVSIGLWWRKDDVKLMDDLFSLFRDNRVISLIILFVTFAFALSLILIAPIFVITPIFIGKSLLFGIDDSLSDAQVGVVGSTIAGSVGLFIAGLFLLYRTVKYFFVYAVACTTRDSFSRRGSEADLTAGKREQSKVFLDSNKETEKIEDANTASAVATIVTTIKTALEAEQQQQSQSQPPPPPPPPHTTPAVIISSPRVLATNGSREHKGVKYSSSDPDDEEGYLDSNPS